MSFTLQQTKKKRQRKDAHSIHDNPARDRLCVLGGGDDDVADDVEDYCSPQVDSCFASGREGGTRRGGEERERGGA